MSRPITRVTIVVRMKFFIKWAVVIKTSYRGLIEEVVQDPAAEVSCNPFVEVESSGPTAFECFTQAKGSG